VLETAVVQLVLLVLTSILYPIIEAPNVELGFTQDNLALAVLGDVEAHASTTTTERTALAEGNGAAFAACAGAIRALAKRAAKMPLNNLRVLDTRSAYSPMLKTC
jgi:hypothetical protein